MAKNTGFAALAVLQTQIKEEPTNSETQDELPDTPEETTDVKPASIDPAQPTFDDEQVVVTERVLNDIPVTEWTTPELEAYIAGTVKEETYIAAIKAAMTEHRIRETTIASAWSVEEAREYFRNGVTPPKTSKGAWVNDVTRQYRREHEWETNELESWALGEIKAVGVSHDGGLAIELKRRLNLRLNSVDVNDVITNYKHATGQAVKAFVEKRPEPAPVEVTEDRIAEVTKQIQLEGLTIVNQSYIECSMAKFEAAMKPGRAINETTAGDAQKLLKEVMQYAISLPDPVGSKSAMTYLLEYFRANRADGQLFEDTYAFRGIPDMKVSEKEKIAHRDLLTLFLVYADPVVELRGQTDVPTLIGGVAPQFKSRLLQFFSQV